MHNSIWITTEFEGYHKYENAPNEVAYLRCSHRHLFKLKVYLEIYGNDREVEFHLFKKFIKYCIKSENFNNKSCEQIANDLYLLISHKYPGRDVKIDLSEDGECGCEMNYYKHRTPNQKIGHWSGLGEK